MNIFKKRNELLQNSMKLRSLALDKRTQTDLRELQKEMYRKWEFYDKYIKANDILPRNRA